MVKMALSHLKTLHQVEAVAKTKVANLARERIPQIRLKATTIKPLKVEKLN